MDRAHFSLTVHQADANPANPDRTAARVTQVLGEGQHWFGQVRMAHAGPLWAWSVEVDAAADGADAVSAFLDSVAEYAMKVRYDFPKELPPPADALARSGRAITNTYMPNWWIFSSEALAAEGHAALVAFIRGEEPRRAVGGARPVRVSAPGGALEPAYVLAAASAGVREMVRRFVRSQRPGYFTWANGHLPAGHPSAGEVVEQKATAFETFRANPHIWDLLKRSPTACHVGICAPLTIAGAACTPFFHDPRGLVSWCVRADTQAVYAVCSADAFSGADWVLGECVLDGAADVEEFVARVHYEDRAWHRAAAELRRG